MTRDDLIERMAKIFAADRVGSDVWDELREWEQERMRDYASEAVSAIEQAGLVIVPRDSTDAMHHAGRAAFETAHDEEANSWEGCEAVWSAMIEASPFVEKDAD